ncbi:MAG: hypothetical protein CMP47_08025 [Rickettsiales bacterium]|nr:hypothetical protein [Rickettsiales bacterium]
MNKQTENELRSKLKTELLNSTVCQPSPEQDAVFQTNLEQFIAKEPARKRFSKPTWHIAAVFLITIGFAAVITQNYFGIGSVGSDDLSSNPSMSISELITASNELEAEIAKIQTSHNNTLPYIEILKIREDIGELDDAINKFYQSGQVSSKNDIQALWNKRLEMTKHLKGLYTNQYVMARI